MICPNCKTELVEVNGRFICSDCGREIPENEVMASDWGNGGTTRAGLYGAGTDDVPEDGSKPITDFDASLSEIENEITTPNPAPAPVPDDEPSVEEILQQQAAVPDTGFYTPTETTQNTESGIEHIEPVGEPSPVPVMPTEEPETSPEPVIPNTEEFIAPPVADILAPELESIPEPVTLISVEPAEPVSIPEVAPTPLEPVVPTPEPMPQPVAAVPETVEPPVVAPEPLPPTPEVAPEQPQVAKDMFEYTDAAPASTAVDPGIYADPLYEGAPAAEPVIDQTKPGSAPMPRDKRITMIVLISGVVLVVLLIAGGLWGYFALNAKVQPVSPATPNEEVTWQALQVPEGDFKISFPGSPEKTEGTLAIGGIEVATTTYMLTSDETVYTVGTVPLDAEQVTTIRADMKTSLPILVNEVATGLESKATVTKVGKYYTADAIDFTLASDTAKYQGKIMINGSQYILVLAGSPSGNSVEYDKFIKSFAFSKAESNNI